MTRLMMAAAATALLAGAAQAEDRGMEFRLGVTAHDLADHVEDGPNVTAELLFASPDFLSGIWSPRPYIYGSFNTNGLTNFGAAGLAWNIPLSDRWHLEIKEGLSYNDGVVDIDQNSPPNDPNRIRLATTRALMGSHYLFHTTLGLDYDVNERWAIGAYYEHISHGQILASGRNQALDNAGVRLSYRFGARVVPVSPVLRLLLVAAGVLAILLAAVWFWLDAQFDEPGARRVPSIAGEVGARSVLAVFAHPDDEQSVTGLLIRAQTRDGAVTRMITATRGEAGTPLPQVSRPEELGIIRHAEVLKNGWALGLEEQEVWDYPDGGLSDADYEVYVGRLMERMQAWQPDLIVTFWPESGLSWHPDHRTAGRAATEAVQRLRELDPETAPRAIAYILAPRRMMGRFGGERGQHVVDNQPEPNLQMPGEGWAKVRGWQIHASQRDYLQHAYGIPTALLYALYDMEHYYVVEF